MRWHLRAVLIGEIVFGGKLTPTLQHRPLLAPLQIGMIRV